jgi:tetratricopeptide (TPR) repeat protein
VLAAVLLQWLPSGLCGEDVPPAETVPLVRNPKPQPPKFEPGPAEAADVVNLKPAKTEPGEKLVGSEVFKRLLEAPDAQFDLAAAILALNAEAGLAPANTTAETLARLDELAKKAREQLPDKPDVTDYYDALYDVVLNRHPIQPPPEDKLDDFDLNRAIYQHRGNCLTIGIEALAVARRMNAPIQGAQIPGHFFLRGSGRVKDKEVAVNFDVTRPSPDNWTKVDDDFYRKWRHFDSKEERNCEYLKPMSDKYVVSAFLASRSGLFSKEKRYDAALLDADRALELNPRNVIALINAGYARECMKKYEEAEAAYLGALELNSQSTLALNNLAFVKIRDRHSPVFDVKRAEKYIDQALKIDPDAAYLYATKGEIAAVKSDYREATRYLQTAWNMSKNTAYHDRFMELRAILRASTVDPPKKKKAEQTNGEKP